MSSYDSTGTLGYMLNVDSETKTLFWIFVVRILKVVFPFRTCSQNMAGTESLIINDN